MNNKQKNQNNNCAKNKNDQNSGSNMSVKTSGTDKNEQNAKNCRKENCK